MNMYDLIKKKRDGYVLEDDEIAFFVKGCTDGSIPDYQLSAMCMAVFFRGMNDHETAVLTENMAHSGETVDLSEFGNVTVDKHSTGGVGDKTSMIVSPIVASLGGKVAKMTARGLGHTGGTVDKLESIKGFRIELEPDEFMAQVDKIGVALVGQSAELAPADKKLYALRDVTATVDTIPLIASSIMSKKIAAGAHSIVLDVKTGSGAFMKTPEQSIELAQKMVDIGASCGRNMAALITNMDIPLGHNIGNALEVIEAAKLLNGEAVCSDLRNVCVNLASYMIALSLNITAQKAEELVLENLANKKAFAKFKEWISAQGGDTGFLEDVDSLVNVKCIEPVRAVKSGYITHMDAEQIGRSAVLLGAGRMRKEDPIDHSAGIVLSKKTGEYVNEGETIAHLYTNKKEALPDAEKMFLDAVLIGENEPEKQPLIYKIITNRK